MGQWLREISNCCSMEKITYILKRKNVTYDKVWGQFTQLLGNVKGPMSWPFLLIIIPLLRYTKIDLHCSMCKMPS